MKTSRFIAALLLAAATLSTFDRSALAAGPGATLVTEDPTPPRACTGIQDSGAWGTAQFTLTIPACAGFIYICSYDEDVGATTAPAATLLNTTSTNLGGMRFTSVAAATATSFPGSHWAPAQPYRATLANTAVTIVGNAAVTSVNYHAKVTYFCAP